MFIIDPVFTLNSGGLVGGGTAQVQLCEGSGEDQTEARGTTCHATRHPRTTGDGDRHRHAKLGVCPHDQVRKQGSSAHHTILYI